MSIKSDIVNKGYSKLRISGLTVNPTAPDLALALGELESMMAELFGTFNLDVNYNFEVTPAPTSETGVSLEFENMMVTNLALRLISDFNKNPPPTLFNQASQSLSNSIGVIAAQNVRQIQAPRRMPRGSGNTIRGERYSRYTVPTSLPPNDSATNRILEGEIQSYEESFAAYLGTETISSFTIVADPRLVVSASANADPLITYTITAKTDVARGPFQQVKITVTTSTGRIEIRLINFEVIEVPEVG